MKRKFGIMNLLALITLGASFPCLAQQENPQPSSLPAGKDIQQDSIKVFTEEVMLPVVAFDDSGKFDPTVEANDLLILEDGIPQQVRSVSRKPASVLFLLDMNSVIANNVQLTREITGKVISHLQGDDEIAIIQAGDSVKLLQDWTNDKTRAAHVLQTKLFPAKRSQLSKGVSAAIASLNHKPPGNVHVVLITGGVMAEDEQSLLSLMRRLAETQAAVHLLSYSTLTRQSAEEKASQMSRPRIKMGMINNPVIDRPAVGVRVTVNTDREMQKRYKSAAAMERERELQLIALERELGTAVILPGSIEEAVGEGDRIGREIESQYIVTYAPKHGIALSNAQERREVKVVPRRIDLQAHALRSFVVVKGQ